MAAPSRAACRAVEVHGRRWAGALQRQTLHNRVQLSHPGCQPSRYAVSTVPPSRVGCRKMQTRGCRTRRQAGKRRRRQRPQQWQFRGAQVYTGSMLLPHHQFSSSIDQTGWSASVEAAGAHGLLATSRAGIGAGIHKCWNACVSHSQLPRSKAFRFLLSITVGCSVYRRHLNTNSVRSLSETGREAVQRS